MISAWWRRFPSALIGVAIPGGYVVVDVDGPQGWAALEAEGYTLPTTLTAITGRGEWHRHLWYRLPDGVTVGCVKGLLPCVDTRALGGYVIVPPSRSVFGPYTWADGFDMEKIADAPEWLLERCTPVRKPGEARPASEWVAMLREPATEGHRHETLLRVAGLLLRRHDATVAVELARAWARGAVHAAAARAGGRADPARRCEARGAPLRGRWTMSDATRNEVDERAAELAAERTAPAIRGAVSEAAFTARVRAEAHRRIAAEGTVQQPVRRGAAG